MMDGRGDEATRRDKVEASDESNRGTWVGRQLPPLNQKRYKKLDIAINPLQIGGLITC
jgi:hypothetical protein